MLTYSQLALCSLGRTAVAVPASLVGEPMALEHDRKGRGLGDAGKANAQD